MTSISRREFLHYTAAVPAFAMVAQAYAQAPAMRLGLCTYLWGKDWDLPAILKNCAATGVPGVELRVEHAHNVSPALTPEQRADVKKQFADSDIVFVGMGTNQAFDSPKPEVLKKSIEETKAYILLSQDCGGSGVKVKPNDFQRNIPHEVTIEQIGKSLNEVAAFGADHGQQIRLEVHGSCCEPPTIKAIMDVATHPNVKVCWNCNDQDTEGAGFQADFDMLKGRFGDTVHVRELNIGSYPYQDLIANLVKMNYGGWVLLEARTEPADRVAALAEQAKLFQEMVAKAKNA